MTSHRPEQLHCGFCRRPIGGTAVGDNAGHIYCSMFCAQADEPEQPFVSAPARLQTAQNVRGGGDIARPHERSVKTA